MRRGEVWGDRPGRPLPFPLAARPREFAFAILDEFHSATEAVIFPAGAGAIGGDGFVGLAVACVGGAGGQDVVGGFWDGFSPGAVRCGVRPPLDVKVGRMVLNPPDLSTTLRRQGNSQRTHLIGLTASTQSHVP
jgi:hypothetical protein